jgi:hypothetical protein
MNTNTDQKKTHTPRKVEKRAPRTPAGYECRSCANRYAPDEAHPTKAGLCFDCEKE